MARSNENNRNNQQSLDGIEEAVAKQEPASKISLYGKITRKADTKLVINDLLHQEDEFLDFYFNVKGKGSGVIIQPPYNPVTLQALAQRNNILGQAISTMEVNVDGTGYTIQPKDSTQEETDIVSPNKLKLEQFFSEPYPEVSFVTQRRQLRFDIETTGNGYLEVIRNVKQEIVFLRYLDATTMRLARLDDPVLVEKIVERGTDTIRANIYVRERRFVQKVGTKLVYFKEFGASRRLNRDTGEWFDVKDVVNSDSLSSEIIHFTCEKDTATPYGVPRWINQLPSVMGSRKAEEFNLDFFDSGGIPPAVVFVQGGTLTSDVSKQLNAFFSGGANNSKHRVAVVEVQSSTGTINDSGGSVQVRTERFGDSKGTDAMFQTYDKSCEEHVRVGFRLPPIFFGRAQDYNFASAVTAYMVAEAQVFQPERLEFDEIINIKVVRALGIKDYILKSNPLTLKNVELQLKAIESVKTIVDDQELIENVNSISGLTLKFSQDKADASALAAQTINNAQTDTNSNTQQDKNTVMNINEPTRKAESSPTEIVNLVSMWNVAVGIQKGDLTLEDKKQVLEKVSALSGDELELFNNILASKSFLGIGSGLDALACGCAKAMTVEE